MEKRVEQVEQKMSKNSSTSSKSGGYEGFAAARAADLMIGFWFGIGAILAIKMVNSLEELISRQ